MKKKEDNIIKEDIKPVNKSVPNIQLVPAVAIVIAGVAAGMVFQYLLTKQQNDSKKAEAKKGVS